MSPTTYKNERESALAGMYAESDRGEDEENGSTPSPSNVDIIEHRAHAIATERAAAREGLVQQAKKIKHDSDAQLPPPNVGATVHVPVPGQVFH